MNDQEKDLWIQIYTQTFETSRGNHPQAQHSADQAVSDFRKSQERFYDEQPVR